MKRNYLFATLCLSFACTGFTNEKFSETIHPHWGQTFDISRVLMEEKNDLQHMVFFENEDYGNVLVLDGVVQTTEKDEFVYHEMIAHVPILAHGNVKNVLIVGGGDGGTLREVLRHKSIKDVTLVEIDERVINLCKKYLPKHSNNAFDDQRAHIVIQDAFVYANESKEKFDIIICDTTDPIGPGAILFTTEFFERCKKIMNEGGILVNQCGVPFMQADVMINTNKNLKAVFADTCFYIAPVPTYIGGFMCFGWATDNVELRKVDIKKIEERMSDITGELKYYTPNIQSASFALPKYLEKALATE